MIACGSTPYDPTSFATTFDPLLVRWSDQGNTYEWVPAVTNQSGEQGLSHRSYIVTANNTRQEILIWTDTALFSMQYVGPPFVWSFTLLDQDVSIASQNAVLTVNNVVYWMGRDKFFMYSGRVETLPCTLRQFVYNDINYDQLAQVVAGANEGYNEIWWFYPSGNSELGRQRSPAADLLQDSSWYRTARPTRRKVLTTAVASPPRQHANANGPHVQRVDVHTMNDATRADKLAHTPLVVLVEDREADGVLLDIFVEDLGWPELVALWDRGKTVTPRAIDISTAAGIGAIPQRIARAVEDATREGRPILMFVLCDSDLRWPGDTQSKNKVQEVRDACTAHGLPHHVLLKRSVESYIPDEVIEEYRDDPEMIAHVNRFDALLRRSRVQRDHFPVKDGLKPGERDDAIAAGIYDHSERGDLALLEERLFPKRPRPMLLLSGKRRAAFTAAGLRARDGNGEIDDLLAAIAREL